MLYKALKALALLPFVRPYCTSAALYSPVQSGCIRASVRCIRRTSLRERVVRGCACVRVVSVYAWLTALYIPCYTSAHICAPIYRAAIPPYISPPSDRPKTLIFSGL